MLLLLLICDDDNCYTIGAIHIVNDESDYAYDMKRPKLHNNVLLAKGPCLNKPRW